MDGSDNSQVTRLRAQRDRFVSFALAGADALVELDAADAIAYAAGTTERLFALSPEALAGRAFHDLVTPGDRRLVDELLVRLHRFGRLERKPVHLLPAGADEERPAFLSGLVLPERPQAVSLVLSRLKAADGGYPLALSQASAGGMTDGPEAFATAAARTLREATRLGEDLALTLMALPVSPQRARRGVEAVLRAWSAGSAGIGRLGEQAYVLLHDHAIPGPLFAERLAAHVPELAGTAHATLDVTLGTLAEGEVSRALIHAIRRFLDDGPERFSLRSLAEAAAQAVDETVARVGAFRQTLGSDSLALVFQPVVDLRAWQVHHYEAFARLRQGDKLALPARALGFAGDFGVMADMDLAILRRVLAVLRESTMVRPGAVVSANITARSLVHEGFAAKMLALLEEHHILAPRLTVEVTEATVLQDLEALNKVLQKVRALGSKVALDDFGKGAIGFAHLRSLQVDFVKIDGSTLEESFSTRHGKPFLKAVAALCRELDIRTIGEMVEDDRTLWLLRDAGVDFGQGYLFGKPLEDVSAFTLHTSTSQSPSVPVSASASPRQR